MIAWREAILTSVRAITGLGYGHDGHHASAYSLTLKKMENMLSGLGEYTVANYQEIYKNFENELLLLNQNYYAYLKQKLPEDELQQTLDHYEQATAFNKISLITRKVEEGNLTRILPEDQLQFICYAYCFSQNTINACRGFVAGKLNSLIEAQQIKRNTYLLLPEALNSFSEESSSQKSKHDVLSLMKEQETSMDNEICSLYAELITTMANEYIIQKSRQYYVAFVKEGNLDPEPALPYNYPDPADAYEQLKKNESALEKIVAPTGNSKQKPIPESAQVTQAEKYLQAYCGFGASENARMQLQGSELFLAAAVHATLDLLHYPRVKEENIASQHYSIVTKSGKKKYAVGVAGRGNDLDIAGLVLIEHLQNIFSTYRSINPIVREQIYRQVLKKFSEQWVLTDNESEKEKQFEVFLNLGQRYGEPWQSFGLERNANASVLDYSIDTIATNESLYDELEESWDNDTAEKKLDGFEDEFDENNIEYDASDEEQLDKRRYPNSKHQYLMIAWREAILISARALTGLGYGHDGHHASAYSLTLKKMENMLSGLGEYTVANYQEIYKNFENELLLLNRNYHTYLSQKLAGNELQETLDHYREAWAHNKTSLTTAKIKEKIQNTISPENQLQFICYAYCFSQNTINACRGFVAGKLNNLIEAQQTKRNTCLLLTETLNTYSEEQLSLKSKNDVLTLIKDREVSMDNELCNLYAELITTMANEYIIQKSRQYYVAFVKEGNLDPEPALPYNYPEPADAYEQLKKDELALEKIVAPTRNSKQKPIPESAQVTQAEKYLQAYCGFGESENARMQLQGSELFLAAAVHATLDLLHYPRVKEENIASQHYSIVTKSGKKKYAVGVASRGNDLDIAGLVLIEHLQNIFSTFRSINPRVREEIYRQVLERFSEQWVVTVNEAEKEKQLEVFLSLRQRYGEPWRGFGLERNENASVLDYAIETTVTNESSYDELEEEGAEDSNSVETEQEDSDDESENEDSHDGPFDDRGPNGGRGPDGGGASGGVGGSGSNNQGADKHHPGNGRGAGGGSNNKSSGQSSNKRKFDRFFGNVLNLLKNAVIGLYKLISKLWAQDKPDEKFPAFSTNHQASVNAKELLGQVARCSNSELLRKKRSDQFSASQKQISNRSDPSEKGSHLALH